MIPTINEMIFLTVVLLLSSIVIILVSFLFFQPYFFLRWLTRKTPGVIFFVKTQQKVMALTIDDGPDPNSTPQILDLLAEFGVKATFFLISENVLGHEDIVERIINEGHEIGNHNTKEQSSLRLTAEEFEHQLSESHKVLSQFSNVVYYRPGSGWYNKKILNQIKRYNYLCVMSSIHPYDPQIPSVWFSVFHILVNNAPGSIILLHEGATRGRKTIAVLNQVLPKLKERGYYIGTVSDLLEARTQ